MRAAIVFLACFVGAVPARATIYPTSELGWSSGQDVSDAFAEFLANTATAGDELRLDHTYRISGTHQLPDDFTLSAVAGDCDVSLDTRRMLIPVVSFVIILLCALVCAWLIGRKK